MTVEGTCWVPERYIIFYYLLCLRNNFGSRPEISRFRRVRSPTCIGGKLDALQCMFTRLAPFWVTQLSANSILGRRHLRSPRFKHNFGLFGLCVTFSGDLVSAGYGHVAESPCARQVRCHCFLRIISLVSQRGVVLGCMVSVYKLFSWWSRLWNVAFEVCNRVVP